MAIGSCSGPFGLSKFDLQVELFLNPFVNRFHAFDWVMLRSDGYLKGVVIMLLAWYALFEPHGEGRFRQRSELLLGSTLLSMAAIVAARGLAILLPFRVRPIGSPALDFHLPTGASLRMLGWSSFPSDHAVLFFTIATGIFFVSRPLGGLALAWVASVICFPRLYLGLHWPTDILAGAALGVSIAQIAGIPAFREWVRQVTSRWHRDQPGLFFASLFLLSYEISTLFDNVRHFLFVLWRSMTG
jgi:undecaprenyl-diphosphatase